MGGTGAICRHSVQFRPSTSNPPVQLHKKKRANKKGIPVEWGVVGLILLVPFGCVSAGYQERKKKQRSSGLPTFLGTKCSPPTPPPSRQKKHERTQTLSEKNHKAKARGLLMRASSVLLHRKVRSLSFFCFFWSRRTRTTPRNKKKNGKKNEKTDTKKTQHSKTQHENAAITQQHTSHSNTSATGRHATLLPSLQSWSQVNQQTLKESPDTLTLKGRHQIVHVDTSRFV